MSDKKTEPHGSFDTLVDYTGMAAGLKMDAISFGVYNCSPILELLPNGNIMVNGRLTENDIDVVNALREFLATGRLEVDAETVSEIDQLRDRINNLKQENEHLLSELETKTQIIANYCNGTDNENLAKQMEAAARLQVETEQENEALRAALELASDESNTSAAAWIEIIKEHRNKAGEW